MSEEQDPHQWGRTTRGLLSVVAGAAMGLGAMATMMQHEGAGLITLLVVCAVFFVLGEG